MSYAVGKPVISMELVIGETETALAIGDSVELTVSGPNGDYTVSGELVAISLNQKPVNHYHGANYDGIPTQCFQSDDLANIHNAADYFAVDYIMVKTPAEEEGGKDTFTKVPVYKIKSTGAGAGTGGSDTPTTGGGESNKDSGDETV